MPMRHRQIAALLLIGLAFEVSAQTTQTNPVARSGSGGVLDPAITQDPLKYQATIGRLYYNQPHLFPGAEGLQGAARFQQTGSFGNGRYLNHSLGGAYVPRALDASYDRSYMPPSYSPLLGPQDAPGGIGRQLPGLLGAGIGVLAGFHLGGGIGGIIGGVVGYVAGHALKKMLNPQQEFSLMHGGFQDPDPYNQYMGDFRGSGTYHDPDTHTSGHSGSSGNSSTFIDADAQLPGQAVSSPVGDGDPTTDLEGLRSQYEEAFQRYVEALESGRAVGDRQKEYEAANERYQQAIGR